MSNLIAQIQRAQRDAGEAAVIAHLEAQMGRLRCADETPTEKALRERKESALRLLAPLGFEDAEDIEAPGAIFHRDTGLCIDVRDTSPQKVVRAIFEQGRDKGADELRAQLRRTLGL